MAKTNPPGKNMAYISTSLNKDLLGLIDSRAKKIGLTRGGFLRYILLKWYEEGCPPVTKVDRIMFANEPEDYAIQIDSLESKVAEDKR